MKGIRPAKCVLACLAAMALGASADPGARSSGPQVFMVRGQRHLNARDVATRYGMTLRAPPGKHLYIQSKWTSLGFQVDSRELRFNDRLIWLHAPLTRAWGKWLISEADVKKIIDPLLLPSDFLGARGSRVIVLDPGHGGPDRGARGRRNVEEKRVVLDIAKRARAHLANAGLKVYLTRETDRYIELEGRAWKASRWGADAFVSIHLNSAASSSPKGIETYVLAAAGYPATAGGAADKTVYQGNRFDGANTILGARLQDTLVNKVKGVDRGLRRARFAVLRSAPCPAALVECGFLSNAAEETKMLSADHREKIALAIAQGVLDYVNAVKKAKAH